MKAQQNGKVIFADQLRVLAFLCVVVVHWIGVYSIHGDVVSRLISAPISEENLSGIYKAIVPPIPFFNYGPFGVAIFFLISGFVVSFSLESKSALNFLKARLLRIYPTYVGSVIIMLFFLYISSVFYWGNIPSLNLAQVFSNSLLVNNIFGVESIDAVNWTLAIEVKFYLLSAIFRKQIINEPLKFINYYCVAALSLCFVSIYLNINFLTAISGDLNYICFMMVGLCFYVGYRQRYSYQAILISSAVSFFSFAVTCKFGDMSGGFELLAANYFYAIALFFVSYVLGGKFRENSILSFLSNISYPFYALHSVIGYIILRILEGLQVNYFVSLFLTFLIVLALATLVHKFIEKRFISKRMSAESAPA